MTIRIFDKGKGLRAFSLPEMLVVLVIIGILVLIALPNLMPLISKAKAMEAQQQLAFVHNLQKSYFYTYSRYSDSLDEISESAFLGFEKKGLGPGYMKLLGQNEEWHLEFYQVNNKNKIDLQAIFKSQVKGQSFSETYLNKQFKSFCETRHAMLKEKSLTEYVTLMPYLIRVTLPMKLKLTADDYRYLYSDIKAFVSSIDCEIVKIDSNR